MNKTKILALIWVGYFAFAFLTSCSVVQQGADVLGATGQISESDKQAIVKTSQAVQATFAEITEEQEYYIGRGVAALILSRYQVYDDPSLTAYINTVGQSVVYFSDRPEIYAGYHFLVLDTEEVNALSAPGGLIFVSKGLLRRCKNEEMLADVLAHEVGHVTAKHGLQSIKKSRLVDLFGIIGTEAAKRYGPEELAQLTNLYSSTLGDVVDTLILRGYDRKFEYQADTLSVKFSAAAGYLPQGLVDFLQTMVGDSTAASAKGWFKTHPSSEQRIEKIQTEAASLKDGLAGEPIRTKRFQKAVAGLK